MNIITNELRKELKKNFGSITTLDNVNIAETNPDYWVELLKDASWIADGEEQNYLDLVLSHVTCVEVRCNDALVGAIASIEVNRKFDTETIYTKEYDDIHTAAKSYEYQINRGNYSDYYDRLLKSESLSSCIGLKNEIVSERIIYDVTTKGQEAVPDCDECHGSGVVPCRKCGITDSNAFSIFGGMQSGIQFKPTRFGMGILACNRCDGSGKLHCNNCDNGRVVCSRCGGVGFYDCPKCGGTGSINYNAGNYADGSLKIKSKSCPICNGKGILPCPNCHGEGGDVCPVCGGTPDSVCPDCNGEGFKECSKCHGTGENECPKCHGLGKERKADCVQIVKSFVDTYTIERNIDVYFIPDEENKETYFVCGSNSSSNPFYAVNWFKPYQLYRMYNSAGQLVEDNSKKIADEVCGTSETIKKTFEKFAHSNSHSENKRVCSIENYYRLEKVLTLTIEHSLEDYCDLVLYIYDGNVWTNGLYSVSVSEKMKIQAKSKIKSFFSKIMK